MVSKSMAPPVMPGISAADRTWRSGRRAPANAAMVAFGSFAVNSGRVTVNGWLFDAKNRAHRRSWASSTAKSPARTMPG